MPDIDSVKRALHCRGQDLMIDLPPCDQCEYRFEMPNGGGCDFRRLCRDAAEMMTVQEAVVRCKDCKHAMMTADGKMCKYCAMDTDDFGYQREVYHDADWFCADGKRRTDDA